MSILLSTALTVLMVLAVPSAQAQTATSAAPVGRPEVGKAYWDRGEAAMGHCSRCHGLKAEGGFGPDLAGRGLSFEEVRRAVRQPWGIMPAMNEMQMNDQFLADLAAYFATLPKVSEPGRWRTPLPANAPLGQQILVATAGCGQCHGTEFAAPRRNMGAEGGDYEWLAKRVYEHTSVYPQGFMGNFSRLRLPEPLLRELWQFVGVDLGPRALVRAALDGGKPSGANTVYTLTVENGGVAAKGLAAEEVSISLALPSDARIVNTTGSGYEGVHPDAASGGSVAIWKVRQIAAAEKQVFTVTLAGAPGPGQVGKNSSVRWAKPALREGVPNIVSRDDSAPVALPR